jgi:hypothetical protein
MAIFDDQPGRLLAGEGAQGSRPLTTDAIAIHRPSLAGRKQLLLSAGRPHQARPGGRHRKLLSAQTAARRAICRREMNLLPGAGDDARG